MDTKLRFCCYSVCLFASVALNIILLATNNTPYLSNLGFLGTPKLSWTLEAAAKAEAFAALSCSGHGRAYLDGPVAVDGADDQPVCECNRCYGGSDCSVFQTDCTADVDRLVFSSSTLLFLSYGRHVILCESVR